LESYLTICKFCNPQRHTIKKITSDVIQTWHFDMYYDKKTTIIYMMFWCPLRLPHNNDVRFVSYLRYLRYLCLFAYSSVQHIFYCGFFSCYFVLSTLCCQFLWIVYFWLPLRRSLTFIYVLPNVNFVIRHHQ
jgi:hypothetical protein